MDENFFFTFAAQQILEIYVGKVHKTKSENLPTTTTDY